MEPTTQPHVPERLYLWVAAVLAVVTAVEVAVPYLFPGSPLLAPLLLALGAFKFAGVAAYFMHLRFDRRYLTAVFGVGLALALVVAVALAILL